MEPFQFIMFLCRLGEVTAYWVATALFAYWLTRRPKGKRRRYGR